MDGGPPDDDDDGFDAAPTRKRRTPIEVRTPTESERREHARIYAAGRAVPVVAGLQASPRRQLQTAEERDTESERQRQIRARATTKTYPHGMLVIRDEETSDAFELVRVPDPRDVAAVRRSGREPDSPVKAIEFSQAIRVVKEQLRKERESAEVAAREGLRELLDRAPREVADKLVEDLAALTVDVADLKRFVGHQRSVMRWIGGGLGAAVLIVGGWLYHRGSSEGSAAVRLQQVERAIDRLENLADRDRDRRIDFVPPFPTQKGPPP